MTPKPYRRKPVVLEAMLYDGTNADEIIAWCGALPDIVSGDLDIVTLEGNMRVYVGDYVIRGIANEFFPCRADIFAALYEAVEDGDGDRTQEDVGEFTCPNCGSSFVADFLAPNGHSFVQFPVEPDGTIVVTERLRALFPYMGHVATVYCDPCYQKELDSEEQHDEIWPPGDRKYCIPYELPNDAKRVALEKWGWPVCLGDTGDLSKYPSVEDNGDSLPY